MNCLNCNTSRDLFMGEISNKKIGPFCGKCWEKVTICEFCNKAFVGTSAVSGEKRVCSECAKHIDMCSECKCMGSFTWQKTYKGDLPTSFKKMCKKCFDRVSIICMECDKLISKQKLKTRNAYKDKDYILHDNNEILIHEYPSIFTKYADELCVSCFKKKTKGLKKAEITKCKWCSEKFPVNTEEQYGTFLCPSCRTKGRKCNHCNKVKDKTKIGFIPI